MMVCAIQNAQKIGEAGPALSAGWTKACSVSAAVQKYNVACAQRHRVSSTSGANSPLTSQICSGSPVRGSRPCQFHQILYTIQ